MGKIDNRSWNCGHEGPTDDPAINNLRSRQKRNLLVTLFLSQGVPMLRAGDEIGQTQSGNNNAYCQDNEISWLDWERADEELLKFVRGLIRFRRRHPVFRRRRWFQGRPLHGSGVRDIGWFKADGEEMSEQDWNIGFAKSLGMYLNGTKLPSLDRTGEPITDDTFYLLFNAHHNPLGFILPSERWGQRWTQLMDTYASFSQRRGKTYLQAKQFELMGAR